MKFLYRKDENPLIGFRVKNLVWLIMARELVNGILSSVTEGDANDNKLAGGLAPGDQIPRLDFPVLHLMPGTIISCRLAAVDSWDRVFIHLLGENREKGMRCLLSSGPGRGSL